MAKNLIHRQFLKTTGEDWDSKAMTTATGTYYSDAIRANFSNGFCSLLVLTTAGALAITFEVSDNGSNWYTPYNADGNTLNTLATALDADRWIQFNPQVSEWIRFKFVLSTNNSTVSAIYRQQERA